MNEVLTTLLIVALFIVAILGIANTIAYFVTRNDPPRFTLYRNPPPPEKSTDDMSVRELYEAYYYHRNKFIESEKAVKKLESAVESVFINGKYENNY